MATEMAILCRLGEIKANKAREEEMAMEGNEGSGAGSIWEEDEKSAKLTGQQRWDLLVELQDPDWSYVPGGATNTAYHCYWKEWREDISFGQAGATCSACGSSRHTVATCMVAVDKGILGQRRTDMNAHHLLRGRLECESPFERGMDVIVSFISLVIR